MARYLKQGPDGFSTEKYVGAVRLRPTEWADQIEHRLILERLITMPVPAERQQVHLLQFESAVATLLRAPLTPVERPAVPFFTVLPSMRQVVSQLTVDDMRTILLQIERNCDGPAIAPDRRAVDDIFQPWSLPLGSDRIARVNIELDAGEDVVVEHVRELLRAYRNKASAAVPPLTRNQFIQWHLNRVLPYADLMLWSTWRGGRLTEEKLIELLVPEEKDGLSHPLRNTKRDFKKVFRQETVDALRGNTF